MFIIAWLSKLQVLSSRQWGGQSSLGVTGLFWLFFSLLLASLATGLRLLFDLGLGTGHLVALGFSGQVCSSQISKTIKGATPGGRLPAEAAGDGWRGLRGACSVGGGSLSMSSGKSVCVAEVIVLLGVAAALLLFVALTWTWLISFITCS